MTNDTTLLATIMDADPIVAGLLVCLLLALFARDQTCGFWAKPERFQAQASSEPEAVTPITPTDALGAATEQLRAPLAARRGDVMSASRRLFADCSRSDDAGAQRALDSLAALAATS